MHKKGNANRMKFFFDLMGNLWYVWVLILLLAVFSCFKTKIKGFVGEKTIAAFLKSLPGKEYFVLNDIILPTASGTTQIDHIVVSPYGIFVIETKNYKGWIFGTETSAKWTQNIYGKKSTFMNPIHQNYAHVKAITSQLAGHTSIPIIPIVAFSGNCDLKVETKSAVVYFSKVTREINKYREVYAQIPEVEQVCALLQNAKMIDSGIKKTHVAGVKSKIVTQEKTIAEGRCPRCGGALISKNGKYGAFTACSNYPKCKFTKK